MPAPHHVGLVHQTCLLFAACVMMTYSKLIPKDVGTPPQACGGDSDWARASGTGTIGNDHLGDPAQGR